MGNKQSSMAQPGEVIIAFDLYDSLIDTSSIKDAIGDQFGKYKGAPIATLMRRFQLEYTWRLNSMNQYRPLPELTRDALVQALNDFPISNSDEQVDAVMKQYTHLAVFEGVSEALEALESIPGVKPVIFSNGTKSAVTDAIQNSPELSRHADIFKHIVTADDVKRFKPHPELYYHLAATVGLSKKPEDLNKIWLVSANSFDIVGARAVGINTAWVRSGQVQTWTDKIVEGENGKPHLEATSVKDAVAQIGRRYGVEGDDVNM